MEKTNGREIARLRVLLVEDDMFIAEIYNRQLQLQGFVVEITSNIREASALVARYDYDLLLIDVIARGKEDTAVAMKLETDAKNKEIPAIVIAKLGKSNEISKALELGAVRYITESQVSPALLARSIERLLPETVVERSIKSEEG